MAKTDAFLAIADPNRRYILEELRRSPRSVSELAAGMSVSRPAVSQHLKCLLDAGLVSAQAKGTTRLYALAPGGFKKLNIWIDQFWAG
jgi:DNA-binding transcriptional ArsR family regulator